MQTITYRRAQNSDSKVIKNILEEAFEEYEINLPAGYSIIAFNKETPVDAVTAFQSLITAGKLELVRWVDPSNGSIKELYYTTFPSAGWVNEIGNLTEGQGYIIKLNAPHSGFQMP